MTCDDHTYPGYIVMSKSAWAMQWDSASTKSQNNNNGIITIVVLNYDDWLIWIISYVKTNYELHTHIYLHNFYVNEKHF